ncbi:MAG: chaperone modulator CbpM [Candidatus Margulisbacteria bacterium]|nr:chaperone modulator CbpM [Candidatus Margulisiibacteriota bacterium]
MGKKILLQVEEIITQYNLEASFIIMCIENEWIELTNQNPAMLDQEDISRVLLIQDLKEAMGVNDDSVPIILNLIDQLHCLQNQLLNFS